MGCAPLSAGGARTYPDLTADGLAAALGTAAKLYVSGSAAEITALPQLLDEAAIGGSVTGLFSPIVNSISYASADAGRRCRSFFLNKSLRQHMAEGLVDFCPWTYAEIADWCASPDRFDAAIIMVSPPDSVGNCSLGIQADFLPIIKSNLPRLIGVINPAMPQTFGSAIPIDRFSAVFAYDQALLEFQPDIADDPTSLAIAKQVVELVPDAATIQVGIGRIPQAVTQALSDHNALRVHSGFITDDVLILENAGVLDQSFPVLTGVAVGTKELYEHLHRNDRFLFRPVTHTHSIEHIGTIPRFVAINGAIEVDLFGQVNSEFAGGRMISGSGGLPAFMRGAKVSPDGMSIVALTAKPKHNGQGGIVSRISEPGKVTLPRHDLDAVITENGVAHLNGLSVDECAEALIAIADASERNRLADDWRELRKTAVF